MKKFTNNEVVTESVQEDSVIYESLHDLVLNYKTEVPIDRRVRKLISNIYDLEEEVKTSKEDKSKITYKKREIIRLRKELSNLKLSLSSEEKKEIKKLENAAISELRKIKVTESIEIEDEPFDFSFVDESGNEIYLNEFISKTYLEILEEETEIDKISDEELIIEGTNIDATKEFNKMKKEMTRLKKSCKKAMRNKDFETAQKEVKNLKSLIETSKKTINDMGNNLTSTTIGIAIRFCIFTLKHLISFLPIIGLNISLDTKKVKQIVASRKKIKKMKDAALMSTIPTQFFVSIRDLCDFISELSVLFNKINESGSGVDSLNLYKNKLVASCNSMLGYVNHLQYIVDKKEKAYKEKQEKKNEKEVKESIEIEDDVILESTDGTKKSIPPKVIDGLVAAVVVTASAAVMAYSVKESNTMHKAFKIFEELNKDLIPFNQLTHNTYMCKSLSNKPDKKSGDISRDLKVFYEFDNVVIYYYKGKEFFSYLVKRGKDYDGKSSKFSASIKFNPIDPISKKYKDYYFANISGGSIGYTSESIKWAKDLIKTHEKDVKESTDLLKYEIQGMRFDKFYEKLLEETAENISSSFYGGVTVTENGLKYATKQTAISALSSIGSNLVEEKADLEDEMKPIVSKLNAKGYKVKYASPGHSKLRKKEDKEPDGVFKGKLYSDARVMFDKEYNLGNAPKYWKFRLVDGCSYLDVVEYTYDEKDGTPDEAFSKWKTNYMNSLKSFVDDLGKDNKDDEKEETTTESVNFSEEANDIMDF